MACVSPSSRRRACLDPDAVPITSAPARRQICSAAVPTPPAAACTSTIWPRLTLHSSTSMCHAVTQFTGIAAASAKDMRGGISMVRFAGTTTASE